MQENNNEIAQLLLEEYNKTAKGKVLFTQFRNLSDTTHYSQVFTSTGYLYEEHLNILINLKKEKERIWSEIHPTRRKQIGRSERRGVETSADEKIDSGKLKMCYVLLEKVYGKIGLPLPPFDYFKNAAEFFSQKGILKLFVAAYNKEIIGFRLVLCYKAVIYDWYAAGSADHADKYPNDVLPWEIFKWGSDNGFAFFDFGGAGKPLEKYGVRDYKMKFGGEVVNFGRYIKIHKRLTYSIIMTLFQFRKKLLKKR